MSYRGSGPWGFPQHKAAFVVKQDRVANHIIRIDLHGQPPFQNVSTIPAKPGQAGKDMPPSRTSPRKPCNRRGNRPLGRKALPHTGQGRVSGAQEPGVDHVPQHLFKGQSVLFVHRLEKGREHHAQHDEQRPGVANRHTGQ